MITETNCLLVSAVTGEMTQSDNLPDSRRHAFDQTRTKTSANVAFHTGMTNAKSLFHHRYSIFPNCDPPNRGQKHSKNSLRAPKIDRPTSKNTTKKKGTRQIKSQTG
jgi:hypothetical protein